MEILVYKFKKITGNPNFIDLFKRSVNRFKRAGYEGQSEITEPYLLTLKSIKIDIY